MAAPRRSTYLASLQVRTQRWPQAKLDAALTEARATVDPNDKLTVWWRDGLEAEARRRQETLVG